ncbi:F510_1955 family glycosylhydrolase [Effusibacillus lacus]|uniref:Uncharacterized protein n=1 Tax=Effusibacillus lacus TaxID=1348429 RepID=A0A292YT21_9BACL|nr:YCF48-related protein [Effusibacillus lacus]TCS74961.1 photosystem II stability/assembly factor-like uncharacterized protein [Effusibacillus lacus]GAX91630.1 hypothetical protein EFBL_3320 [Effusibacillus lacus]
MKLLKLTAVSVTVALILTGCGAGNSSNSGGAAQPSNEPVAKIEHMHGLTYSSDGSSLYIATHEGLLNSKDGKSWNRVGENLDLMGFNVMPDGTMITSGHPGKGVRMPNPLGFMSSKDSGKTWKALSMDGKIDFHILVPNQKQPNIIYGLNQMGEGKYGAGIYKSTDGGSKWEQIKPQGLPNDLHKVITFISMPDNPDQLLAGVDEAGILASQDGGKTWKLQDDKALLTALQVIPGTDQLIGYVIASNKQGIMVSKDKGKTWDKLGLDLGNDAVAYITVNPKDTNQIVAASYENSVYETRDGGKTWIPLMEKGSAKQ